MKKDKKQKFVFLSSNFYNDYPSSEYPEIESKKNRPYIQVCVSINGVLFGIPLRSGIKHPHVLWTDKENNCGVDFSKAVVITDDKYIDYGKKPHIRDNEFKALKGKDFKIKQGMEKYIGQYISAKENLSDPINSTLCEFSTLRYFEEFIIAQEEVAATNQK